MGFNMKRLIAVLIVLVSMGFYCGLTRAESFAVSGVKLAASTIDLDATSITAKGKASLISPRASVKANTIKLELMKGKDNKLVLEKATATGGVEIHASQIDKSTDTSRTIVATGDTATMVQSEDTLVLTGNVEVKVTDPQLAEPATLAGDKVTIFLKKSKIQVQRSSDKQSEITVTPKEKK